MSGSVDGFLRRLEFELTRCPSIEPDTGTRCYQRVGHHLLGPIYQCRGVSPFTGKPLRWWKERI